MAAQLPDPRPSLERRERGDAARNRRRVLAAAEELFAARGAGEVTMEDIARAAGVGKGTLYRRFPDRASIAVALLDEHERALQEQLLPGPPTGRAAGRLLRRHGRAARTPPAPGPGRRDRLPAVRHRGLRVLARPR